MSFREYSFISCSLNLDHVRDSSCCCCCCQDWGWGLKYSMTKLQSGTRQAINNCLSVQSDDRVIIVTDKETQEIGSALLQASMTKTQVTKLLVIEDYTDRPAKELSE